MGIWDGNAVRLWNRIITAPDSRMTKMIFERRQIEEIFKDANAGFNFRNVLTRSVSGLREKTS